MGAAGSVTVDTSELDSHPKQRTKNKRKRSMCPFCLIENVLVSHLIIENISLGPAVGVYKIVLSVLGTNCVWGGRGGWPLFINIKVNFSPLPINIIQVTIRFTF